MEVAAKINISTPAGRKIVKELEKHKKLVKVCYPLPFEEDEIIDETYSVNEVFAELDQQMKIHYGIGKEIYTQQEFEDKVKAKFNEIYGVSFDKV